MNATPGKAREAFLAAVKMSPEAWPAYLAEACGGDEELRCRVANLLKAHQEAGSFLAPDAPLPGAAVDEPLGERAGTVIGSYRLMEQIGEGGMGLVFVAEQQRPVRRKVALKVIKPGMDSAQVIARFEAERQALALMDHPNIAKVHDGGETDNGAPYFVMELVKGVPITDFCDQNQVPVRQRLELFVSVCSAVQHAHQKGIIHRDIKPSNVLVMSQDGTPVVKVIDFGIAKAIGQQLTDKTIYTNFAQLVGTPLYMSPEQAGQSSLDVDTRSDIYSLGVLLYELLTGTTPFTQERLRQAGYDEMRRIIREEEPPRPSTRISTLGQAAATVSAQRQSDPRRLTQVIRGELDWIVMKALEKDRNRRYETASAFAADVQRYLHDEPVQACPPSRLYELRKFARRNKAALAIAGLILFVVVLVGGGVGWQLSDRAARQREAEGRALEALKAAEPRLRDGHPWDPALISAAQRVEAERESGGLGPEVCRRAEQLRQDMRMLTELDEIRLRQAEGKGAVMIDLAGTMTQYAGAFSAYGIDVLALEPSEAVARVRNSAIRESLLAALAAWMQIHRLPDADRTRIGAVADDADDNAWRRQFRQAALRRETHSLKALAGQAETLAQPPSVLAWLGSVLRDAGLADQAETILRQAQQRHPSDFWINFDLGHLLSNKLDSQARADAIGYFRAAVAIRPSSAQAHCGLGVSLYENGDTAGALAAYQAAIELAPKSAAVYSNRAAIYHELKQWDKALADYNQAVQLGPEICVVWNNRGTLYAALRQWDKAVTDYSRAIELEPRFAVAWSNRGKAYAALKQRERAITDYSKALELDLRDAAAWKERGKAWLELGQWDRAIADFSKAIELDPNLVLGWNGRGVAHARLRQWDKVRADFSKAIDLDPEIAMLWLNRGDAHLNLGQPDKALADCSRAVKLNPKLAAAWNARSVAHARLEQWDKALADISRAVQLQPEAPMFQNNLAWALVTHPDQTRRDPRRAIELAEKAVRVQAKNGLIWTTLGVARYRAGDGPGAVAALREALECFQGASDFQMGVGRCLFFRAMAQQKIGNGAEARNAFERAQTWLKENAQALKKNAWAADEIRRIQAEAEESLGIAPRDRKGKRKD